MPRCSLARPTKYISQSQAGILQAGQPLGWYRPDLIIYDVKKRLRAVEVFEKTAIRWDKEFRSWVFYGSLRFRRRLIFACCRSPLKRCDHVFLLSIYHFTISMEEPNAVGFSFRYWCAHLRSCRSTTGA